MRRTIPALTKDVFLASYIAKVGDTIGAGTTTAKETSLRDAVQGLRS